MSHAPLRAITFDYWDTLYEGSNLPERIQVRVEAVGRLLTSYGVTLGPTALSDLYRAAGREAERWWRDERGYTTVDRLHWTLRQMGVEPRSRCDDVEAAARTVDAALLSHPPSLLPGAAEAVRKLASRYRLAIISDTGFASGRAQDALLAHDGLLEHFRATVYSCDVGVPKPKQEMFEAALRALGTEPRETLHVGDIERTDVCGALAMGMRAIRLDVMRDSGESAAERVVRSFEELLGCLS